jgi:hypothetical protein
MQKHQYKQDTGIDDACARAKELQVYQIQVLKKKRERSWRDLLSSS